MRKSIKFNVFISIAALLFLISCRKDLLFDKLEKVSISEKFFAHSGKTEKIILSVIDEIRNRNNKKEFVSNFAIKNGLPIWNKPIISYPVAKSNFSNSFSQSNIEETDATDTFVYVPIVLEDGDKVNGFILAKINNGVELLYSLAKDYKAFSFENGVDLNDASKFVVMNLLLNKEVFGVSNYKITDYNLFTGDNETDKANSLSIEGRLAASECAIISWQSQYCGTPYYTLCRSECDNCLTYCYPISSSVEICTAPNTVTWPAGGIGISAGGGVGSGESGGGGDIPHYYPCISTPQSVQPGDPLPPCPEPGPGSGWQTLPYIPYTTMNPCDIALNSAKKMDEIYERAEVSSALIQIANLNQPNIEHGFPIFANYSVSPTNPSDISITNYVNGDLSHGDSTHISFNYNVPYLHLTAAILHTHPPIGFNAPSAEDVYQLIRASLDSEGVNGTIGNFVVGANGNQFALTVTDKAQAASFFMTQNQYLNGTDWNENTPIGEAFSAAKDYYQKEHKNDPNYSADLAYEFGMAVVLNKFNSGITLCKKDARNKFKPMIISSSPYPRKPKKIIYTQECN